MSTFTPVYRPSDGQQSFLSRHQNRERKRKREDQGDHDSSSSDDAIPAKVERPLERDENGEALSSVPPVSKTDPYHVAGQSREAPLPPPPFPHAARPDWTRQKNGVEEELAALHPPLYTPKQLTQHQNTSSKRRHVDNLTFILHQRMLRRDWQRAARAWGLLLRTEIAGRGTDIRPHGRWGIGAELLLRRNGHSARPVPRVPISESSVGIPELLNREAAATEEPAFSDDGFRSAREYYERLVLQYPHLPRTAHHSINAVVFYPALFNVWIYEVQDRSKRARRETDGGRAESPSESEHSSSSILHSLSIAARRQELQEALSIASRMDELMLSPPYDTSVALIHLRGMVALWLADLHGVVARATNNADEYGDHGAGDSRQHQQLAEAERHRATTLFRKIEERDGLPKSIKDMLDKSNTEETT